MGIGVTDVATGYNYFGSYAIAVALGKVKKLNQITNGDTIIWTGPILASAADIQGKVTLSTTIGQIQFYFGTPLQEVNGLLSALVIDLGGGPVTVAMPAYRYVAYCVCIDVAFGGQPTPPSLTFSIERESEGLTLSAHNIGGDCVIPEALYQYLTHKLYGKGLDPADIDAPSFTAAAETVITEGIGFSPDLDSSQTYRDTLGRMLACVDGFPYFHHGKLKMALNRDADTSGLPVLDQSDLLDEPIPRNTQFDGTWNKTVVTFTDSDNKWESSAEQYKDDANAAIVGEIVENTVDYPWITKRATAKKVAKRIGIIAGRPKIFWDLKLQPSWKSLKPGDRFKLSYPPFGIVNRVVQVRRLTYGRPSAPEVTIQVQEDTTRNATGDYIPAPGSIPIPPTLDDSGAGGFALTSTTPRLSWLPDDLKGGEADGMLVAVERTSSMVTGTNVYWTYDPTGVEYRLISSNSSYPAKATLKHWHTVRATNWMLRVQMAHSWDTDWLQALHDHSEAFYAVVGRRDWKTVGTPEDEHQVMAPWLKVVPGGVFHFISGTLVDIEVQGGAFGTDDLVLETLAVDSKSPTTEIYFGRKQDFIIYASSTITFERTGGNAIGDTAEKRYIKTPVRNHFHAEHVVDVTATNYDRDDTTMCPDGTLSRTWGARAKTAYEVLDEQLGLMALGMSAPDYPLVADLDAALGAMYGGTATADQIFLVTHMNDVFGGMLSDGHTYYNV